MLYRAVSKNMSTCTSSTFAYHLTTQDYFSPFLFHGNQDLCILVKGKIVDFTQLFYVLSLAMIITNEKFGFMLKFDLVFSLFGWLPWY